MGQEGGEACRTSTPAEAAAPEAGPVLCPALLSLEGASLISLSRGVHPTAPQEDQVSHFTDGSKGWLTVTGQVRVSGPETRHSGLGLGQSPQGQTAFYDIVSLYHQTCPEFHVVARPALNKH